MVRADPERVTQILVNLLSNAIKFTPVGGRISADWEATAIPRNYVSATAVSAFPQRRWREHLSSRSFS
jgi:signal transduction histidine kinase